MCSFFARIMILHDQWASWWLKTGDIVKIARMMTVMQISWRPMILICIVHALYLISISEYRKSSATLFGSCENYFYLSKNYKLFISNIDGNKLCSDAFV